MNRYEHADDVLRDLKTSLAGQIATGVVPTRDSLIAKTGSSSSPMHDRPVIRIQADEIRTSDSLRDVIRNASIVASALGVSVDITVKQFHCKSDTSVDERGKWSSYALQNRETPLSPGDCCGSFSDWRPHRDLFANYFTPRKHTIPKYRPGVLDDDQGRIIDVLPVPVSSPPRSVGYALPIAEWEATHGRLNFPPQTVSRLDPWPYIAPFIGYFLLVELPAVTFTGKWAFQHLLHLAIEVLHWAPGAIQ
ncbi:MAG: hypothetical protein AMXMBFR84_48220 [Candidatus Hydrogenedentota bacterium]